MSITQPTPLTPANPAPTSGPDAIPPLPDDVRAFCDRHGLTAHLPTTFRLIREEFNPVGEIVIRLMEDPDADYTSFVLTVPLRTDAPVLACFQRFLERWIPITPADVRQRISFTWSFPRP
jgi:hypothetical protein